MAEGFSLASGLKTAVAEYHNTNGVFPDGTTDAHSAIGIEASGDITGKYVTGVTVSNDGQGTITATFGSGNHEGKFLRLTPEPTDGAISFNCTTDIDESYRPSGCEESTGTGLDVAEKKWTKNKQCPTRFTASNLDGKTFDDCKNDCGARGEMGCCFFNPRKKLCQFRAGETKLKPANSGLRHAILF